MALGADVAHPEPRTTPTCCSGAAVLTSLTSTVSRRPSAGAPVAPGAPLAHVVVLAARRPGRRTPEATLSLHITPELLLALGGSWARAGERR